MPIAYQYIAYAWAHWGRRDIHIKFQFEFCGVFIDFEWILLHSFIHSFIHFIHSFENL